MFLYCIDDFKNAFEKLISKNSYQNLELEVIRYFFDQEIGEITSGTRLNNNENEPFIKKD